jgi:diaminopimelate epimerase
MHFTKYTGLGNDFIFLDGSTALGVKNPGELAVKLCDRRFGIGADGLVLLLPSQTADVRMRIINSDGSEAEMCGNASRAVALHMYRHGGLTKKKITLETLAGPIVTEIIDEIAGLVRVNMGRPRLTRGEIPVAGDSVSFAKNVALEIDGKTWVGTGVSMGNPHFVIFVDDIKDIALESVGPKIETHSLFPRKINVEFVQVLDEKTVRMRVWERGAGITSACGTGACATAVACVLNQKTVNQISVILDGGTLEISWADKESVWMTGPATEVFSGEIL